MRITRSVSLSIIATLALWAGSAIAQGAGGAQRIYDPGTETTVKGTVEKITEVTGRWSRTHLTLRTDGQSYDVHVGPSDYVSKSGLTFAEGDQVEVTGSHIKSGDTDMIIAREIKKDGKTLTLRDSQGIPKWSRGRRRTG